LRDFQFPFAHDKATGKPSVTLFFAYVAFWQTFTLIIISAFQIDILTALIASFVLFLICIFFYRARGIDKLKAGREGFELSNDTSNDEEVDDKKNSDEPVEGWGSASGKSN
jgi:hypothetical protein